MIKLKPVAENTWLVLSENTIDKIGLLLKQDEFIFLADNAKTRFKDEDEVNDFFNTDVFSNIIITSSTDNNVKTYVDGYPTDTKEVHIVEDRKHNYPVFSKTASKKVLYSAGYFCIKYPTGWQTSFCPKISTLEKRDHRGPFKTEQEMKAVVSSLRKNERN